MDEKLRRSYMALGASLFLLGFWVGFMVGVN